MGRFMLMRLLKWAVACMLVLGSNPVFAQVSGGQYAFEFLRLPNSPHVTALGGISVANPDADIALALQNPAMMRPGLHNELQLSYNKYYAGISIMNLQYGWHAPAINTSLFFGVQFMNYGDINKTSVLGQDEGVLHTQDYAITLGASRKYREHWRYGAGIKLAHSYYGAANGSAAMADVGINYYDTSSLFDFGVVAKNMGVMLTRYTAGNPTEPIPFDLQLGISKRFKHLPLRLFTTIHHLYEWDIRYNNPEDITGTGVLGSADTITDNKKYIVDKIFRHFIFGAELTLGQRVILTGSYNFLHRKELALETQPGITGFAFGLGINLNKFQVHYGRSYYHVAGAYNEISITMALNKITGLGKTGEQIHWNAVYPDWE
jgi:hypothetical protein